VTDNSVHNTSNAQPRNDSTNMKLYVDNEGYITFPDGARYKGHLDNGIPEGEGHIIYTDGSQYFGDWRSGNSHGNGKLSFPDGSEYDGNWSKGKYHGKGAY